MVRLFELIKSLPCSLEEPLEWTFGTCFGCCMDSEWTVKSTGWFSKLRDGSHGTCRGLASWYVRQLGRWWMR